MASSRSLRKGQVPVCCKLCEVETKLSWKCMDCDILMCDRCKEKRHSTLRNADKHKVVDVKDIGLQTEELDFSNIKCEDHKNQVCFMFCKSCDQLVCPQCIAKIHNGHGLVEISEGYQIQTERLMNGQNQMKKIIDVLTEGESKFKEIRKVENTKYEEAKKTIQAHNISLKKSVDQFTENLMKELDQKWDTFKNSIEKEERKLTLLKKDKMEKKNHTEEIINSKDVGKMFEIETKALEKYLIGAEKPLKLEFTPMPTFVPGEISLYNVGSLQDASTDITLQVIKEYTTDISKVNYMSPCVDSLWISNQEVVQKVQPEVNNLKVLSSFDIEVYGMAVTPSNDLLFIPPGGSVLKQMNSSTGEMTDTTYSIAPLFLKSVHVTRDYKVVMGGKSSKLSRRVVIMMDREGKHKTTYEYDRNNQTLFTLPKRITSTFNGNICVVDRLSSDYRGRVVVLGQDGDIINIYTGHPDINTKDTPFKPASVVTTPADNIIVPNMNIGVLHILNSVGHLITYINTRKIGIESPYIVNFTSTGKVYVGCTRAIGSTNNAKLYEVKLLGC